MSSKLKKEKYKVTGKKSLREILSQYWKKNKLCESSVKEELFVKEAKKKMEEAAVSFNSMMEIHNVLVDVYKKLIKKAGK